MINIFYQNLSKTFRKQYKIIFIFKKNKKYFTGGTLKTLECLTLPQCNETYAKKLISCLKYMWLVVLIDIMYNA